MEIVQPIRDKDLIQEIKDNLKKPRDKMMFILGINTGLRVSDLLSLKVKDVNNCHIIIKEQKTGKEKRFLINNNLKEQLKNYIKELSPEDYLFQNNETQKPISRIQAYRILNKAIASLDLGDRFGTHTLRKTFGYHHYQQFKDIAILQDIFNHSSPSITMRYIGITDDLKDATISQFSL